MKFTIILLATMLSLIAFGAHANEVLPESDPADVILGIWATDKAESHIEISRTADGTYTGTIIWLDEPFYPADDEEGMGGQPKVDRENPDPDLRERSIVGLQLMHGFVYDGDQRWADGEIYDPESGNTYSSKIWLTKDGTLKVRGYVGISLFGRTTEWTPVLGVPDSELNRSPRSDREETTDTAIESPDDGDG